MRKAISRTGILALIMIAFSPARLNAQSLSDEPAIEKVVEQLLSAFCAKDYKGIAANWATNSPHLPQFNRFAQTVFASFEEAQLINLSLLHVKLSPGRARVRLRFDWQWRDSEQKQHVQQGVTWDIQLYLDALPAKPVKRSRIEKIPQNSPVFRASGFSYQCVKV